jgi:hypothetical protein
VNRRRRPASARDQSPSGFSAALQQLCDSTNALSAALVDSVGETVDYAGVLDPFETRVAAAEWGLIIEVLKCTPSGTWSETAELYFRGRRRSFVIVTLGQGYALVLELPARRLYVSPRAIVEAVRTISEEAGLEIPGNWTAIRERWTRVSVQSDRRFRRPVAVWREGRWFAVEILGRLARDQLRSSETGYRVRIENGAEITLVREPLNHWYADDPLAPSIPQFDTKSSAQGAPRDP